jgi:hypothetical protein
LPPHRGAVFKQRPQHNLLCLFRARLLGGARLGRPILVGDFGGGAAAGGGGGGLGTGGDASIQRGGFFAAAPWHGIQATPPAQLVVPVSGVFIGGVVEMAKTRIPAAKTYELAWVSPRRAGGTVKVRFSCGHQNAPRFRQSTRLTDETPPVQPPNQRPRRLGTLGPNRPQGRSALIP